MIANNICRKNTIYLIISLIWLITSCINLGFISNPETIKESLAPLLLVNSLLTILFLLILYIMCLVIYYRKLEPLDLFDRIFGFMIIKFMFNITAIIPMILAMIYIESIMTLIITKLIIVTSIIDIISYIVLYLTKYRISYIKNLSVSTPLLI